MNGKGSHRNCVISLTSLTISQDGKFHFAQTVNHSILPFSRPFMRNRAHTQYRYERTNRVHKKIVLSPAIMIFRSFYGDSQKFSTLAHTPSELTFLSYKWGLTRQDGNYDILVAYIENISNQHSYAAFENVWTVFSYSLEIR